MNEMAPDQAQREKIRVICRKFLNTKTGQKLDPLEFLDDLVNGGIVEEDDARLIREESRLPQRQYYFFLQILPSLEPHILLNFVKVLTRNGTPGIEEFCDSIAGQDSGFFESAKFVGPDLQAVVRLEGLSKDVQKEEQDGAVEEVVVVRTRVNEVAIEVAPTGAGSVGDEIVTPEELESSAQDITLDEGSRVNVADVQVKQVIGRGGYAVVHAGVYDGQQVAVKKFTNYDTFALAMFKSEIDVMKQLEHVNLVRFIGYVRIVSDRQLWLLTELVHGGSMRRFCSANEKSVSIRDKLEMAVKCWLGVAYLHNRRCCHKDLSPDNVLISDNLNLVKISDFGLAEFKELMVTATTKATGTPMYQPPEFACTSGPIRHAVKSDVYSMGASLCELFSGQWFWNVGGRPRGHFQVIGKLIQQRQKLDSKQSPDDPDCWDAVPDIVKPVLREAIHPEYRQRKSAAELRQMTEGLLESL